MLTLPCPLVLASISPRRKELLAASGIPFSLEASDVEEIWDDLSPAELVQNLARQKAQAVARARKNRSLVLGADTLVALGETVLGKPADEDDARRMIGLLQGRTHSVYTGLALIDSADGRTATLVERTEVRFAPMTPDEICAYVACGESLDKAGAYGIQGRCALFIEGISGCYFNVMGLPLHALYRMLGRFLNAGQVS